MKIKEIGGVLHGPEYDVWRVVFEHDGREATRHLRWGGVQSSIAAHGGVDRARSLRRDLLKRAKEVERDALYEKHGDEWRRFETSPTGLPHDAAGLLAQAAALRPELFGESHKVP